MITGSITTGVTAGNVPTGTATRAGSLTRLVRMYHPCSGSNTTGPVGTTPMSPWIYAGILATQHSFVVDNSGCGSGLGQTQHLRRDRPELPRRRRPIRRGTATSRTTNTTTGSQPTSRPYFLTPLKAGWKIVRQTAQSPG